MSKSKQLNNWLWKWHIIAGLVCMPVVALLCLTGSIYLFEPNFNNYVYQDARFVSVPQNLKRWPYEEQLQIAKTATEHRIISVTLPSKIEQATSFRQHSAGHSRSVIYLNPYTNQISGTFKQKQSLMYTVRKLHGELLLGPNGSLIVELVASWFIVLCLTGVFIWWPAGGFSTLKSSFKGILSIRSKQGRRLFWRDMHSVVAFWMSLFMLIIIAGGMPWTEVFGSNLKWLQKQTDSGYPPYWRNAKGLTSNTQAGDHQLSLDQVVAISKAHDLDGEITIKLPVDKSSVYTISNHAPWLADQYVIHLDQYSGEVIKKLEWSQVGILMELRLIFMRLHQGEYGLANLVVTLIVALSFLVATLSSLISYLMRRPKGKWGIPAAPERFKIAMPVVGLILLLALVFPTFGASAFLIAVLSYLTPILRRRGSLTKRT